MLRSCLLLALLGLAAAPAAAQILPVADQSVRYTYDTGWVENTGDAYDVIISFPVVFETARHLRLYFDEIDLAGSLDEGTGSVLRITSLEDGGTQLLDARTALQWHWTSCYLNGDAVQVEVLAYPDTGPNRLVLSSIDVQPPSAPLASQCGPTDDRVPSNDPRAARLLPVLCTSWLIDDCGKCFLTAGHCVGTISTVQFNVPPSTSGGSIVNPPPEDQYAIDQSSIQSNGGQGLGNDYAYFGCFPNSNTGLTPYEAMGQAFELTSPPAPAGNTIRITGYGADSTPQSANFTQQTHTGPFTNVSGTILQYQVDTQGGNSGSPVIWEDTGLAIGIHTNAGCSTSGSGSNSGTAVTNAGLQNVLANPKGVCLAATGDVNFTDLGGELLAFPFFSAPELTGCGTLAPDSDLRLNLTVPPLAGSTMLATLVAGLADISVPFKGGTLVPSPDVIVFGLPVTNGGLLLELTWPAGVPTGARLFLQDWVDVTLVGGTKILLASNGLQIEQP